VFSNISNELSRLQTITTQQIQIETENDHTSVPTTQIPEASTINLSDLFNELVNCRSEVAQLKQNLSKKTRNEPKWLEEVIYKGENLIELYASQQNKFVTACMEALFTLDELGAGIIKEPNSTSKRLELDPERVSLLKGIYYPNPHLQRDFNKVSFFYFKTAAYINKYQVASEKKAWKFIKKIGNKKCYDTSKKIKKIAKSTEAAVVQANGSTVGNLI
jgi:hypothetical protein